MARAWRAYHPELSGRPGAEITLSRDEAHHLHRVLRLGVGATVHVFDGSGTEWEAVLERAAADGVVLRLVAPREVATEPPFSLTLVQAWCRPEHADWVVQKTTELGVLAVRLFLAEHSPASGPSPSRLERLRRIAIEACKQSGRCRVPRIDLLAELPPAAPDGSSWIADPDPSVRTLASALRETPPGAVALAVGPEGGLTVVERRRALDLGWLPVSLGARTLRAETAAIAAVAIVVHAWEAART